MTVASRLRSGPPLISCIMPTGGRAAFARQAVQYFLRQTWPNKELVIVDDGDEDLGRELPVDRRIRYIQMPRKLSIGEKRNLAIEASQGTLLAHWDDDDWYAPHRLEAQPEAPGQSKTALC